MPIMLQRNDEICVSVNATKVERNVWDGARLNPKRFKNEQSAAKSRIGKRSSVIPYLTD